VKPDPAVQFNSSLPVVEEVIRYVIRKHRYPRDDADDFASAARIKLIEDDYAVFRRFEGRSNLRTYLTAVIIRLSLDRMAARWGKWRPSAAASRLGDTAVLLERLLSRDGRNVGEAYEILRTNLGRAVSLPEIEALARRLPPRKARTEESAELPDDLSTSADAPDRTLMDQERAGEADRVRGALARCLEALDGEDRLILRMRFEDDWPVRRIATALQLEEKPIYRRLERLMNRLRNDLENQGIRGRDVADLLAHGDLDRTFSGEDRKDGPVSVHSREGGTA
jgi:RNA polymerase sigma factor (sigma-70 family)